MRPPFAGVDQSIIGDAVPGMFFAHIAAFDRAWAR